MKKRYCELNELGSIVLEAIGNTDFAGVDNPNNDFRRGAYWGMSWVMMKINTEVNTYIEKEKNNGN